MEKINVKLLFEIPFASKVEISKKTPDLFNPNQIAEEIREIIKKNSSWDCKKFCQSLAESEIDSIRDCRDLGINNQDLVSGFIGTVWSDFEEDLKKSYISGITKDPGESNVHFCIRKNIEKRYISNVFLAVTQLLGETLCKMLGGD